MKHLYNEFNRFIRNIFYEFLASIYYPTFKVGEECWFKIKGEKGERIFKARVDKILIDKKNGETPTMYADNNPVHYLEPERFTINLFVEYKEKDNG